MSSLPIKTIPTLFKTRTKTLFKASLFAVFFCMLVKLLLDGALQMIVRIFFSSIFLIFSTASVASEEKSGILAHASCPTTAHPSIVAGLRDNRELKGDRYIIVCNFRTSSYQVPVQGNARCDIGDVLTSGGYKIESGQQHLVVRSSHPAATSPNASESYHVSVTRKLDSVVGNFSIDVYALCRKL